MYSDSMIQSYQWFFVNNYWIIITICSLLVIIWYHRKNKRLCKLIIIGSLCFLCGVNSITKGFVSKLYSSGNSTFYRLFWILPIVFLFIYSFSLIIKMVKRKPIKLLVFCICFIGMIYIAPCEEYILNGHIPENIYFVSNEIIELNEIMKDDLFHENRNYIGDSYIYTGLQSYSNHLVFPLSRDALLNTDSWISQGNEKFDKLLRSVSYGEKADKEGREEIIQVLWERAIKYLVINKNVFLTNYYEKLGYHYLGETENYIVYERD